MSAIFAPEFVAFSSAAAAEHYAALAARLADRLLTASDVTAESRRVSAAGRDKWPRGFVPFSLPSAQGSTWACDGCAARRDGASVCFFVGAKPALLVRWGYCARCLGALAAGARGEFIARHSERAALLLLAHGDRASALSTLPQELLDLIALAFIRG